MAILQWLFSSHAGESLEIPPPKRMATGEGAEFKDCLSCRIVGTCFDFASICKDCDGGVHCYGRFATEVQRLRMRRQEKSNGALRYSVRVDDA